MNINRDFDKLMKKKLDFSVDSIDSSNIDFDEELFSNMEKDVSESKNLDGSQHMRMDMMLPFADLMTLLLVFFVFFFIINDFEKGQMIIQQNEELIESARLDSLLRLNEQTITIPGEVLFDSGHANLKQTSKRTLAKIAEQIRQQIGNDSAWQIRIEGHTDNVPISGGQFASNWELSTARALIIVKFFMENNFFPPDQMQAMGYGEFKPLTSNDTPENKMKNRRVEIKLSKKHG
jgi:flagellar motor protein MotB